MLRITIPASEKWDEKNQVFINSKEQTLCLEHSLVSLSKWESKWCKPYISNKGHTIEESIDYIKCMTITQNVPSEVYENIKFEPNILKTVMDYINAPMTATWFTEREGKKANKEVITSELIYYWMITYNIPFECQKWHLNRLMTLIRVCIVKQSPPKQMGKREIASQYSRLNAARRKQLNTKG